MWFFPNISHLFSKCYKMGNTALFVIILALIVYRWFPIKDNNLLILMESKTYDVRKLSEIHGIISAFKVEHSFDTYWREDHTKQENKWNVIIITKNKFANDHGNLLRYLDYIRRFSFVEDISVLTYSSSEAYSHFYNAGLFFQEKMVNVFPSLFQNFHLIPLDEDSIEMEEYDGLCSDTNIVKHADIPKSIINIVKVSDTKCYSAHKSMLKQIFLAIGSTISVFGQPEADYWDEVSITKYQTTAKLCEMLMSKQFQDGVSRSFKGIQDARMYSTEQII